MTIGFRANNVADLDRLLVTIEEQKENNSILMLFLNLKVGNHELGTKLWQILSHSHCKIAIIYVTEEDPDALTESSVARAVRNWCETIPASSERKLYFVLNERDTERTRGALTDLRHALQTPNNSVRDLTIGSAFSAVGVCSLFLQPVLENPNIEIVKLSFTSMGYFSDRETKALSTGLASEHCHVRAVSIHGFKLTSIGSLNVFEGLCGLKRLEALAWTDNRSNWAECDPHLFATSLARLLMSSRKTLRSLNLSTAGWQHGHFSILAEGLMNEECKVDKLTCNFHETSEHAPVPLFRALQYPNNLLRSLEIFYLPIQAANALEVALKDVNCKLIELNILLCVGPVAEAIADALASSHLRSLIIGSLPPNALRALARSLTSQSNRIASMILDRLETWDRVAWKEFCRAVRVSNLVLAGSLIESDPIPFFTAFNKPFFRVIHSLLSVRSIPRFCQKSCHVRLLPLHDFVFRIAHTLGWPLADLS